MISHETSEHSHRIRHVYITCYLLLNPIESISIPSPYCHPASHVQLLPVVARTATGSGVGRGAEAWTQDGHALGDAGCR
jgi:hypothetical protein